MNATCYTEKLLDYTSRIAGIYMHVVHFFTCLSLTPYFLISSFCVSIGSRIVGMRKGSFFVSTTSRLPIADFEVLEFGMFPMSWGEATVYIMQKVTEPRTIKSEDDEDD